MSALRADRLATLYVFRPLGRLYANEAKVPVLMYHSISGEGEEHVHPYFRTVTSPEAFAQQMRFLHERGYSTVDLSTLVRRASAGQETTKTVVITFDDGLRDFYVNAFPVLKQYGFTAAVFLPTGYIDDATRQFKKKDCLSWKEVRELHTAGISFGSHTVSHPQLHELSAAAIHDEVVNSKRTIEDRLGGSVESFSYPFAFPETDNRFKAKLRETLLSAGYRNGVCTTVGRVSRGADPLFLERLPVNTCDDLRLFEAKLAGDYDWVAKPQNWAKMAKGWLQGERPQAAPNRLLADEKHNTC